MNIFRILTLFLFTFHSVLWAEVKEETDNKPLKNRDFSIYFQYDSGSSVTTTEKGKLNEFKLAAEFIFLTHFSFSLGLSRSKINLHDSTWNSNLIIGGLFLANSAMNQGNTQQDLQAKKDSYIIGSIFLLGPTEYNYNPTNLNLDFNLHWNTENFIDPYLGVGYQAGIYETSESISSIDGWKGKTGVKVNFNSYYLFFQGEYQKMKISDSAFFSAFHLTNKVTSIGIGYYF